MNRGNGSATGSRPPGDPGSRPSPAQQPSSNMSRAQRFESEKTRISESCFTKVDEQGQQAESYITHLRVEEDGAYPSVPPPSESPPDNKKPRVIIIAVRSTGRVRVHKARENHNGTFSIGKTWNLEDLSAIESFNHVAPDADTQRRSNCQRAGPLGFTVTIGKPYYWKAGTPKERDFFIASLVKIYRKYTKGRSPDLLGFQDSEMDQMFGQPGMNQRPQAGALSPPAMPSTFGRPAAPDSRDGDSRRSTPFQASSVSPGMPPGSRRLHSNQESPAMPLDSARSFYSNKGQSMEQSRSSMDQARPSGEGLGISSPNAEQFGGQDFREPALVDRPPERMRSIDAGRGKRISQDESRNTSQSRRGPSPAASQLSARANMGAPSMRPDQSPKPPREFSGGAAGRDRRYQSGSNDSPELNGRYTKPRRASEVAYLDDRAQPAENGDPATKVALPERKRPPLTGRLSSNTGYESEDLRPPPLSTSRQPSGLAGPSPRLPGAFVETPVASNAPSPMPTVQREASSFIPAAETQVPKDSVVSPVSPSEEPRSSTPVTPGDEEARPGLGSMFKKKDVASAFRRAATAANAFKPRVGGAGARLMAQNDADGQDGVHGVVPAPLRTANLDKSRNNSIVTAQSDPALQINKSEGGQISEKQTSTPAVPTVTLQSSDTMASLDGFGISKDGKTDGRPAKPKRRTAQQEKYLASLGIEPGLFENKGLQFESILYEFGWNSDILQQNKLDLLENDLKREIGRVEAGSWLQHIEQKDERVDQVDKMLDRVIAECDELDGLLTLYSVELSTLNEDIAYIEAQSQGLQVQTANQKILQTELLNLVNTISITPDQLAALQQGTFDNDLTVIETSLILLYQAMLTIDPTVKVGSTVNTGPPKPGAESERAELAKMRALQEKRDIYLAESDRFCQRFSSKMGSAFDVALNQAIPSLLRPSASGRSASWNLHPASCNAARAGLWQFSPLILYNKEVNQSMWRHLTSTYTDIARPLYHTVFRTALDNHKRNVRASSGDEGDVLFTAPEKETTDSLGLGSRKLTMKRSQTFNSKSARQASGEKAKLLQSGRQTPCEAFADMLSEWAPTLVMEQNFVIELFHATSLGNTDFVDSVHNHSPDERRGPADLLMPRIAEPDRSIADHVQRAMQTIFEFFPSDLAKMIQQSTQADMIQAVGIMTSLAVFSAPLHETNQEFLLRTLNDASAKLEVSFSRFIDTQVHAIEDTKVLLKKRKGIINFIRIFPMFSQAVENVFAGASRSAGNNNPAVADIRKLVDDSYERINQSMWVALRQIAKDSPTTGSGSAGGIGGSGSNPSQSTEAEDKEVLNYHILLIENMNHYIEEVDEGSAGDERSVLAVWKGKAMLERAEHLDQYVKRVVRRPLGKLLDFLESTEALLLTTHASDPASIAAKPSHSRSTAKRAFSAYDSKEIRKGIEALRKRVEKHFGPEAGSVAALHLQQQQGGGADAELKLVHAVLDECEREYARVLERTHKVVAEVYSGLEKGVDVEWTKDDVVAGFRR